MSATTTINSGYLANGITLSDATLTNTSSGLIVGGTLGYAVLGLVGEADTVVNDGSIGNGGIRLRAAGTVVNAASISDQVGDTQAIYFSADGSVTNQSGATISAAQGAIKGSGTSLYVTNAANATITGDNAGIVGYGQDGFGHAVLTAVNAGDIGANTLNGSGIILQVGGSVTNQTSGTITGLDAVSGKLVAATVVNYGDIAGHVRNGPDEQFGAGVELAGGYVANKSGGTISGDRGVLGLVLGAEYGALTVVNAGVIAGNPTYSSLAGVVLEGGGTVTNLNTAMITGFWGIFGEITPATVVNYGSIAGNTSDGTGVEIWAGGSVTNQSGGSISGGIYGIVGMLAAMTVTNAGDIAGGAAFGKGVKLYAGGNVTNQAGGTITAGYRGIWGYDSPITVVNAGDIAGAAANGLGVDLEAGGYITNQGSGTITGFDGIYGAGVVTVVNQGDIDGTGLFGVTLHGGGTVANYGTIAVTSSFGTDAVTLAAGYANLLKMDPGALFIGTVSGGNVIGSTAVSTLELASYVSTGTLSGLGTQFIDFAQITIDTDATWTLTGADTLAAGVTLTELGGAVLTDPGTLVNNGTIVIDPSTLTAAGLIGTGSVTIDAGSTLTVSGAVSAGETIVFAGMNAVLNILDPSGFAGAIQGQGPTDEVNVVCFVAATCIATERGEVAVEDLAIGDLVHAQFASMAPINWIGRRRVDCRHHPKPQKVWPVCVAAGAFGPGRPHTDLFLSPDHAVYVNEVLIPIKRLINGSTIAQVPMDHVSYYHIELPQHDVVLAQGLPAESFLDMKDGSNYGRGSGAIKLYPDFTARMWAAFGCAPLIVTGPELEAARVLVGRIAATQEAA